ncbi:MAG: NRDE family protein [Rhodobacteraceae bacterium]|nr:NRDE family protein [Paracoccaceae bacterium]
MCTVVTLVRPGHRWPFIVAANRDEDISRPWKPPARHWPDRPDVIGGLDIQAGGTWVGINDTGVVACILNRHGTLSPLAGKRSRGELVLEALDHADARDAAGALSDLSARAYRPFNMIVADNRDAWWLALRDGADRIALERIPEGLSMFTAGERNDRAETRIDRFLPTFAAATSPDPDDGTWEKWRDLLAARAPDDDPAKGMTFSTKSGFGTSSSSLLALPSPEDAFKTGKKPVWLFAAGPPDSNPFEPVTLD